VEKRSLYQREAIPEYGSSFGGEEEKTMRRRGTGLANKKGVHSKRKGRGESVE